MVVAFVLAALLPDARQVPVLTAVGAGFSALAALALLAALARPGDHPHRAAPAGLGALRLAWSDGFVRRLCCFASIPFGAFIALTTFAQALLAPAGVSAGTASAMLLVNVVAGVIGCAVVPVLAARFHGEFRVLAAGLLVTCLAVAGLAAAPGVATGFVALSLIGFVLLPALPIALDLVERRAGEAEGTATGLVWMAGNLGGLVVATAVGLLVHRPTPAFLLIAGLTLIGLPVVLTLRQSIATAALDAGRPTADDTRVATPTG
jgi:predicted MFS family arabinose efflux permease